jgi:nucleoside-diphosphate-sugar epimerase
MYVAVTGSSGKLGRCAVAALRADGHRVVGLDINVPIAPGRHIRCDCTDFGQVMGALSGIDTTGGKPDAVVHLAGIPMPGLTTDHQAFEVNTRATYNVMSACARLGINTLVWASSETILGLPFDVPPDYAPLDENHPDRPGWSYALSKQLGETMADTFARWHPAMKILSLRFSNVYAREDYQLIPAIQAKTAARKFNLWAYVDAEDAGEACRLTVEADLTGHHKMIIAAADTLMDVPSADLMTEHFPGVPLDGLAGTASLLSSAAAARLIGYTPRFGWRDRT